MATLTIEKVVHHKTPQSGTWLHCFKARVGQANNVHNIKDKEFKGADAKVEMNLSLVDVNLGDTCDFDIGLDDDQDDVCSTSAEDQTSGSFVITAAGSKNFSPSGDWSYTISWKCS
jgi:hypothetical protein